MVNTSTLLRSNHVSLMNGKLWQQLRRMKSSNSLKTRLLMVLSSSSPLPAAGFKMFQVSSKIYKPWYDFFYIGCSYWMLPKLCSLKSRVGIEGFFCIVCNTMEFNMLPIWFFTSNELCNYMDIAVCKKWDIVEVGGRLEAFAIAGCGLAGKMM